MELVYIFENCCHRRKVNLLLSLQWNFYFAGTFTGGLLMREYAVNGTSLMTFNYYFTVYSTITSKSSWNRTIHHLSTLLTLFSSFSTILIYSNTLLYTWCDALLPFYFLGVGMVYTRIKYTLLRSVDSEFC